MSFFFRNALGFSSIGPLWGTANMGNSNDMATLVPLYLVPNGIWILLPSYCVWSFSREIGAGLNGSKARGGSASVKKEL